MSKKLYIAYGSNLNLKQMKYRCPTAKLPIHKDWNEDILNGERTDEICRQVL